MTIDPQNPRAGDVITVQLTVEPTCQEARCFVWAKTKNGVRLYFHPSDILSVERPPELLKVGDRVRVKKENGSQTGYGVYRRIWALHDKLVWVSSPLSEFGVVTNVDNLERTP